MNSKKEGNKESKDLKRRKEISSKLDFERNKKEERKSNCGRSKSKGLHNKNTNSKKKEYKEKKE